MDYLGILLRHKKEWNNTICNNMDGPRDDHTKWNKPQRESPGNYIQHPVLNHNGKEYEKNVYMWKLKC